MTSERMLARIAPQTLLLSLALGGSAAAGASEFGVSGVIDVPSARMRDDGDLTITYARNRIADAYSITYQPMPWLEAAFRYSVFNPRDLKRSRDDRRDRNFEAKVRLWQERELLPQVAVGVRDLVGTGIWSGEYVVANKAFGPFDLSAGLGWGRLAERSVADNPLRHVSDRFLERDSEVGLGGKFSVSNYFSGQKVGAFGSLTYDLPIKGVQAQVAYNSDRYQREIGLGTISDTSPWSLGLQWEPFEDIVVGASWNQGNHFALRLSATVNTKTVTARKAPNGYGAPGTEPAMTGQPNPKHDWYARMAFEARTSGVTIDAAKRLDNTTVNIVYINREYQYEADAVRRVLALAELYAPREISKIILTGRSREVTTHSVHYTRSGWSQWAAQADDSQQAQEAVVMPPLEVPEPDYEANYDYPAPVLDAGLGLRPYLFDPDKPFRYQIYARLSAGAQLGNGWSVSGSWVQNLTNNFDGIDRTSNSVLPRVRSEFARYLKEGPSGIDTAVVSKRGELADDVYYVGFAGILEEMYGGVGAEVLYRPFGSRWGVGANIIGVRKRDYDRGLDFLDYQTVIGHLSVYWASPIYDFDVALHAGRYLARDWGATLEVSRTFANGWSIGAFATLTDVPFDEFGEGSFDKGLVFRIPFNPFVSYNTRGSYSTVLRPIQRDGGQRLNWGTQLWDQHRGTQSEFLFETRDRMVPQ